MDKREFLKATGIIGLGSLLPIGKPIMTLMTVKNMLKKLPEHRFKRIRRSYVIPLSKVRSYVNRKVKLTSVELPVSESYM